MPACVPGYEYDIFISYRQNDNRTSAGSGGWVTSFVKALQDELAATIKEPVSVYFDINSHDGLLETHHVNKSLTGKLKCLIFIPILSQTYCDVKSYAWQHEFCKFHELAKNDSLGRDIPLTKGNVASRVLPVQIHELDPADIKILENEMGSPLRALEFIYKEAGVNRSLKPTDKRSENLNATDYQNQLNKVALAIKDLLSAMTGADKGSSPVVKTSQSGATQVQQKGRFFLVSALVLTLAIGGYYAFDWQKTQAGFDRSIAVLPFVDLTPDKDMEYFGDGLADEIINSLTTIKELQVAGRTSSFQFKDEKIDLRTIGKKLNVGYVLEGSVQRYENSYRITAQLIRTADNFHAWSERFDLDEENIFKIQDTIAAAVVDKLRISLTSLEKGHLAKKETTREAYMEYLKGLHHWKANEIETSMPHFQKAWHIDPNYAPALAYLALCKAVRASRMHQRPNPDSVAFAMSLAERAIELDPNLPDAYSAVARISWMSKRDFARAGKYFEKSIELSPSSSLTRNRYGYFLNWMGDFEKATSMSQAAKQMDPLDWNSYIILFDAACFMNDRLTATRRVEEYKQTFSRDGSWFTMAIQLNYLNGAFGEVIRRQDSSVARGDIFGSDGLGLMARSYVKLGKNKPADSLLQVILADKDNGSCFQAALVFATQNKLDSCFKYLALSADRFEPHSIRLKIQPELQMLRNDPRYIRLYNEIGFDKY